MSVMHITKANFDNEVLRSGKPVLLDFYADWCGPCRMIAPVLEEIAGEHPEITVCKVNVDEQAELARRFGVMSIPSLFVMRDGKVTASALGARSKAQILSLVG